MKKILLISSTLLVICAYTCVNLHADNVVNLRVDQITYPDGTVQTSSPTTTNISSLVPYTGATTDINIGTHTFANGEIFVQGTDYSVLSSSGVYIEYFETFLGGGEAGVLSVTGGGLSLPLFIEGSPVYINNVTEGLLGQKTTTYFYSTYNTFSGNVGISTDNPTAQLHIKSNSAPTEYIVKKSSQDGTILQGLQGDGTITLDGVPYTFPPDNGDANEVMQTDGTGVLTWAAQSGGDTNEVLYDIVIATYAGTGIDLVCDGTHDQVQFQEAFEMLPSGGSVFVKSAFYVFGETVPVTTSGLKVLSQGATIQLQNTLASGDWVFKLGATADNFVFDGFIVDGNSINTGFIGIYNSINCVIKNCTFNNSAGHSIYLSSSGGDYSVIKDCFFNDATGLACIYNNGNGNKFIDLTFDSCSPTNEIYNGGFYNLISRINSTQCGALHLTVANHYNLVTSCVWRSPSGAGSGGGVSITQDYNTFIGNYIAVARSNHGFNIASGALGNTFVGNTLRNIGEGTSNTKSGFYVDGDKTLISSNKFLGTMDKYAIEITANASDTVITNCEMSGITGNVGYISDGGTNTSIIGVSPSSVSNVILGDVTLAKNLTVNGTFYSNASYAIGHAHDGTTDVTGSTSTFTMLDVSWHSDVASNGFTISGASCTYNGTGGTPKVFEIIGQFDISSSGSANMYVQVFLNGVGIENSSAKTYLKNAAETGNVSSICFVELSTDDVLDIRYSADDAVTITSDFITFKITQIN